jgi:hypothetical protein
MSRTFLSDSCVTDTVYTAADSWLDLDLTTQMLRCHRRNNTCDSFRVSSGNAAINKGIDTRPGIYCIQSKNKVQISKQFDDAKMLWWMQFNGNIGFHGLEGNGYYRYLGVRPSSHGCVRMRREDAQTLYSSISAGTPVVIHRGLPMERVVAFLPAGTPVSQFRVDTNMALKYYDMRLMMAHYDRPAYQRLPILPLIREYVKTRGLALQSPLPAAGLSHESVNYDPFETDPSIAASIRCY